MCGCARVCRGVCVRVCNERKEEVVVICKKNLQAMVANVFTCRYVVVFLISIPFFKNTD